MEKKIYISGMHSGQNPCSGVGIARCLRKAFPDLTLVGVDHWQGSSGLHDQSVDEVLLLPQWKQMDNNRHSAYVRNLLDEGNLWISSLDMEVYWFSENMGSHHNLLAPTADALELTSKPTVKALEGDDFRVPEFIPASLSDSEIHMFLRHNSWRCWLKSPYHDAKRITSWGAFERCRDTLSETWGTSRLFLQRHVIGNEETIAFAAYQGELLYAAHLEKRQLTGEGKTWAGKVTPVKGQVFETFKQAIRRLGWSGGGELEYMTDPDGQKWIIECNPRFPAWIYGAALAEMNLPAKLVSRVWNLPLVEETPSRFPFFTRVVQEIPAKELIGIPLPPDPTNVIWSSDGKKGKGASAIAAQLPQLKDARALAEGDESSEKLTKQLPEKVPPLFATEIEKIADSFVGQTPARVHLEEWTLSRFQNLATRIQAARSNYPEVRIGFSLKTSPTDDHLRKAKKYGFFAECISQMEVQRALNFGFRPHEVILNGPGKFWPITAPPVTGLHMLFSDSVEEFERALQIKNLSGCLGFRMRLPNLHSRFGNPPDEFENFQRIVDCIRKLKATPSSLGFHFHMPSWAIGVQRWTEALQALLVWCQSIEQLTKIPVKHLDLGGGFFPMDLEKLNFSAIQKLVNASLPKVQAIYFEPGRSLTQEGEVLVSRILDVRRTHDGELLEVVADACIAELPLAQSYSHRIFYRSRSEQPINGHGEMEKPILLSKGSIRVLGRICMEDDILSHGLDLPDTVAIGDLILFGDAGGYERSMSYVFGRG